ncbi:MAG: glutamate synthase large subunit, partial [Mycobacterium sp.]|nr:glutamate synthase large subunit [Mycobacterium sp.]
MLFSSTPQAQGLYDPDQEHDSCGVAMVVDIKGRRSHAIVRDGLIALEHLEHRGAAGAEPNSGDGAGILLQLPVELLRAVVDFELPAPAADGSNTFAAGICFLPQDPAARAAACARVEEIAADEGVEVLGWRTVPVDPTGAEVGETALGCMPHMAQLFVAAPADSAGRRLSGLDLDRRVYPMRKRAGHMTSEIRSIGSGVYFASLSSRTITYKGMLTTMQLPKYFEDLRDERCASAIAIVHSRFSTNTFPSWPLAHPFRFVAHNGEINTVRGNRNRMHAREAMLASALIGGDMDRLSPICTPESSDSASFDQTLELLHLGGRSLPHA